MSFGVKAEDLSVYMQKDSSNETIYNSYAHICEVLKKKYPNDAQCQMVSDCETSSIAQLQPKINSCLLAKASVQQCPEHYIADFHQETPAYWGKGEKKEKSLHLKFIEAVCVGDVAMVSNLVSKGANVNFQTISDKTAMHVAIMTNNIDMVRTLLDLKFNNTANHFYGNLSPIHFAINNGYIDIAKVLVEHTPDIVNQGNMQGRHCTPACLAIEKGYLDLVKFMNRNDNIYSFTDTDYAKLGTIGHYLAEKGDWEMLKYLAQSDLIDITITNTFNKMPYDIAKEKGAPEDVLSALNYWYQYKKNN